MKTTSALQRILVLPALLLAFAGCQLLPARTPEKPAKTAVDYRAEITRLPGATLSADGLNVSYPGNALFGDGAVLPLPGGMDVLLPLIDWLLENPALSGVAVVRADAADKAYAQRLAESRRELLERLLANRGIPAGRLEWKVEAGAGAPLELQLQLSEGSSSGGKS